MVHHPTAQGVSTAESAETCREDHDHVRFILFISLVGLTSRMFRVPLYAIASFIALFSLDAAFFIDTVRDLYEVSTARPDPSLHH